jgi:hypothetical protein
LLNPDRIGDAYRKIIVIPCMLNSWLYASGLSRWRAGAESCARIAAASRPPTSMKVKAVTR